MKIFVIYVIGLWITSQVYFGDDKTKSTLFASKFKSKIFKNFT